MASAPPIGEARVDVVAVTDKLNAGFAKAEAATTRFDQNMQKKVGASAAAASVGVTKLETRIIQLETELLKSTTKMAAFERQMLQLDSTAAKSARGVTALGGSIKTMIGVFGTTALIAGAGALAAGVGKIVSNIVQLKDQASAIGISTDALQEYRYAAQAVGVDNKAMEGGLEALNEKLKAASLNAQQPVKIFKTLGIEVRDAGGKVRDASEVFPELADKLLNVRDPMERAAVAALILGDNSVEMAKLLEQGSSGIDNLRDAAHRLGIVLSDEQIANADKTAQKLRDVQTVLSTDISAFVANNADAILGLARAFAEAAGSALQLLNSMRNFNDVRVTNSILPWADRAGAERRLAGTTSGRSALRADIQGKRQDAASELENLRSKPTSARTPSAIASREKEIAAYNRSLAALDRMDKAGTAQRTQPAPTGNIDVTGLLAPKGRTPRARKGPADRTDQNEHAYQQQLERAESEHLRLQEQLTVDLDTIQQLQLDQIALKEKSRAEDISYMRKRGQINGVQEQELLLENERNANLERDIVRQEIEEKKREQALEVTEAGLKNELEINRGKEAEARTQDERRKLALRQVDLEFQLEKLLLQDVIASATATKAQKDIAQARLNILDTLKGQAQQAARRETMDPIERFLDEQPQNEAEKAERLKQVWVDNMNDLNQRTAAFADSIAGAFSKAAGAIARLEDPLDVGIALLQDLASTFTAEFIEKPIFDWMRKRTGGIAEDLVGGKAGPYGLDQATINAAYQAGVIGVNNFTMALAQATTQMQALATGAIDPLGVAATATGQEFGQVAPQLSQFGNGLMSVLAGLTGGGGGGFLSTVLGIAKIVAPSITGGGGGGLPLGAGGNVYGVSSSLNDVGIYAEGGWIGGSGTGTSDSNLMTIRASRGEHHFMLNADEAKRNGPLLEMMNEGRLPRYFAMLMASQRGSKSPTINLGGISMSPTGNPSYDRRTIRQLRREVASGVGDALRVGYK